MSQTERQAWFRKELDGLITTFRRDRQRHKRLAVVLKAITVSMAGLVTILLGWKATADVSPPVLANLALVLGALITVVSAYEAFFDPRALWLRETLVYSRLKDLKRTFEYAAAGAGDEGLDERALVGHKQQLDAIMQDSLTSWLRLRGLEPSSAEPPPTAGA